MTRIDPDTRHKRFWRQSEVDDLKRLIDDGYSYSQIATRLGRSRVAVVIKVERINYRRMHTNSALAACDAKALLGLKCSKTVICWITGYGLKARNGGTKNKPLWRIQWLDLCEWLEDPTHWMAYDPARVTELALREHLTEIRQGQPRWLTVGEVAQRYNVGIQTVATWRIKGILPMVRYGNWWIRESDLDGFVPPCERSKAGIPRGSLRVLSGKDGIVAGVRQQEAA
jgi:transposase